MDSKPTKPSIAGVTQASVTQACVTAGGETETDRLVLRKLATKDAAFILELVNGAAFLQFIGDKSVRTLDDARDYISKGPVDSYERFGFGLYLCELKETKTPIGMCGLIKRDGLDDVDIGFAFLPEFWGKGYCYEAASSVLAMGRNTYGLDRIVAITSPDNDRSIRVLERLGMRFERMITLPDSASEVRLFAAPPPAP